MVEPSMPIPSVKAVSRSDGEIAIDFSVPAMSQNHSRMNRTSLSETVRMTSSWRCPMRPVCLRHPVRTERPGIRVRMPGRRPSSYGGEGRGSDGLAAVAAPGPLHVHEGHAGVLAHEGDSRGAVAVVPGLDHGAIDRVHQRRIDGALLGPALEALGAELDLSALQRLVGVRVRDERAGGLAVG